VNTTMEVTTTPRKKKMAVKKKLTPRKANDWSCIHAFVWCCKELWTCIHAFVCVWAFLKLWTCMCVKLWTCMCVKLWTCMCGCNVYVGLNVYVGVNNLFLYMNISFMSPCYLFPW
jgi:hypothetical protein